MKGSMNLKKDFFWITIPFLVLACGAQNSTSELAKMDSPAKYADNPANFRLSLTDKPSRAWNS
jgi:hypothetical protein